MTPIGQHFRLVDASKGHRRWLLQLPKSLPKPRAERRIQLPNSVDMTPGPAEGSAEDPEPSDESLLSPGRLGTSRCNYAVANFDTDKVRF